MKLKDVEFEMKYVGWNMGQYGKERHTIASNIEILELKIDDVDILKEIDKLEAIKDLEKELSDYIHFYEASTRTHSPSVEMTKKYEIFKELRIGIKNILCGEQTSEVKAQ